MIAHCRRARAIVRLHASSIQRPISSSPSSGSVTMEQDQSSRFASWELGTDAGILIGWLSWEIR
jgi:hypothetical protein